MENPFNRGERGRYGGQGEDPRWRREDERDRGWFGERWFGGRHRERDEGRWERGGERGAERGYEPREDYGRGETPPWTRDERAEDRGFRPGSHEERYDEPSRGDVPRGYLGQETGFGAMAPRTGGPHAGRGPRGYQRSDERIREDVCDRLTDHPSTDASGIEVVVVAAEVTLEGSVDSRVVKYMVENLCDGVSGVRDVHNRLRVTRPDRPDTPPGWHESSPPAAGADQ